MELDGYFGEAIDFNGKGLKLLGRNSLVRLFNNCLFVVTGVNL